MKFGRKTLEGYLAVAMAVLTIVIFIVLGTISFENNPGISLLNILVIILIGIEIVQAIILLRVSEKVGDSS